MELKEQIAAHIAEAQKIRMDLHHHTIDEQVKIERAEVAALALAPKLLGVNIGDTIREKEPWAGTIDFVERQGDWIFNDEEYLCHADDGECMG